MGILVILGILVALVVILLLMGVILPSGEKTGNRGEEEEESEGFEE
ncbi:MAG: hypothetical protein XD87_0341 [candidate division WS6 bacterium 36_33]|uniref:Uncharacterized protein n=1 Tax=candidate division WS6 bacterium 36_33 TaxID=1641388 RepID=A0A101GYL9_9BACT|nr:MAG: hypothetical protein XD87_0341 [candidate division WS6 bacterium 36_33]